LELQLNFEWYEDKNRANIRKQGLDFADAAEMFRGMLLVEPDTREDYGEKRWKGIGVMGGRMVAIIFTERSADTIRIISLRKADREEQREYEKAIQDGLEAG
jgi:uncharacterized protein